MNIAEHELKRYDLWQEELEKKNKAYILTDTSSEGGVASYTLKLTPFEISVPFSITFCRSEIYVGEVQKLRQN